VDNGFTYETAIHDAMSAPAAHEVHALGELDAALAKNEKALHSHAAAHDAAGHAAEHNEGFLDSFKDGLVGQIAVGELAAEGLKKLGEAFVEVGEKLVEFVEKGIEFALEAAEFKENMVLAFDVVSQTADEGERTYEAISNIAEAQHLDIRHALSLARELALSGVENEQLISDTVSAQGALQRVGLEAGAKQLRRIVEQSEAIGHLVLPKKLGAVGFKVDDIARAFHETPAQFAKDLKAGKIETERGIQAINAAILGGNVGRLAAQKYDLTDVVTDWHNAWLKIAKDVDSGPLTGALRNFVDIFSQGEVSGQGLKEEITKDVNAIIRVLGHLVSEAETVFLKLELGFYEGKVAAIPLTEQIHKLGLEGPSLASIGDSAREIAKDMVIAGSAIALVAGYIIKMQQLSEPAKVSGHEIGTGFVGGLLDALTGGKFGVVKAIVGLGEAAVDALRGVWKSHSPSEVAYDIGMGIPEGMAIGADAGSDRAARAVGHALAPDLSTGGSSLSTSRTVSIGNITVTVQAPHGSNADEIAAIVEEKLVDVIDRINMELGG
jgi:hypothetical protein